METPVEQTETDVSVNEPLASDQVTSPIEAEEREQGPPYPYSLRHLPGRRNYEKRHFFFEFTAVAGLRHTPDLDKGLAYLYQRGLLVTGNLECNSKFILKLV